MPNHLKGIIFASITAFFWGFLAIALKVATDSFNVTNLVWFRFTFAFMVMLGYFAIKDPQKLKILIHPPLLALLAALGLALNYYGFTSGINHTSPSTAQIVIQLGPISLGLVGYLFFKEKIGKTQIMGFGVAFIGLAFFYYNQVSKIIDSEINVFNMGFIWIVIAALAWLTYASLQKILVKKHDSQMLNLIIFGLPALIYTPFVSFGDFHGIGLNNWLLLLFLGANTVIAYGCLSLAFKYTDVNKVSVIITLNPIITFIVMAILYQMDVSWINTEKMDLHTWLGALMVITGAVMVVYFKKKEK
ncbi:MULTISPECIES: DMT family transporter [unclassified Lentimicrobium]|uniref:DMT family transporter n=1 Tax=unclassified Lentimicrobium TaxID=2677434 RepID=UPI0015563268|nr:MULTISPECIES: DMT family transporter [unclassified Lentimicrobium]NPD46220.1 DMT family transporter [Lentimicrobium sp. S6]NPD86270.1 DMT family transporter [Lentimicrobium sp. L6]